MEERIDIFKFSAETDKIIPAFVEFQGTLEPVKKTMEHKFYNGKYEDINEILELIRQPLYDQKLAVMQFPATLPLITVSNKEYVLKQFNGYEKLVWTGNWIEINVREIMITTYLFHESGQYIRSSYIETPEDNSHHSKGQAITYARKYSLKPILGLSAEDDDGNPIPKAHTGQTTNKAPIITTQAKAPKKILKDKSGTPRFDVGGQKFVSDKLQKERNLIVTADYLAIAGLVKKNIGGDFGSFKKWLLNNYSCEFYDIRKIDYQKIVDVLTNNPNTILGVK